MVCTEVNLEAEDSTSERRDMNTRYKYTTDSLQNPSGLDPTLYFSTNGGFNCEYIQRDLYGSLLQTVQQHYCNLYCEREKFKN